MWQADFVSDSTIPRRTAVCQVPVGPIFYDVRCVLH